MGKLGAGNLLKQILSSFGYYEEPTSNTKFTLYSAHDSTLLALMSAMNNTAYHIPEFTSYVSFELWNEGSKHTVKVDYDHDGPWGEPTSPLFEEQYSLEEFGSLMKDGIPEDWKEECRVSKNPEHELCTKY